MHDNSPKIEPLRKKRAKTGGRQKGSKNKSAGDVKALARLHGPDAIARLVSIMTAGESHAVQVSAARELLDRGYGKAAQTIEANVTQRMVVEAPLPAKTTEEWLERAGQHGPH